MTTPDFSGRRYRALLLPALFSSVTDALLPVFNSLVAGNLLGEEALAVIALCAPLHSLLVFFSFLISIGTAVIFSGALGAGRDEEADRVFHFGWVLAAVTGLCCSAACWLWSDPLAGLLAGGGEFREPVRGYLLGLGGFSFIHIFGNYLSIQVYNHGAVKWVVWAEVAQITGGIVFSIIFCRYTELGVAGVALASSLGALINLVIFAAFFLQKEYRRAFRWEKHCLRLLLRIVKYSTADVIVHGYYALLIFGVNHFIIAFAGEQYLAVFAIVNVILQISLMGFDCLGQPLLPLVSSYCGEGNVFGIKAAMRAALRTGLLLGGAAALLFCFGAPYLPGLFGIDDPAILPESVTAVRLASGGLLLGGVNMVLLSYYPYIDRVALAVFETTLHQLALPVPCLLLGAFFFGVNGLWAGFAVAEGLTTVAILLIAAVLNRRSGGRTAGVLLLPPEHRSALAVRYLPKVTRAALADALDWLERQLAGRDCPAREIRYARLMLEEEGLLLLEAAEPAELEIMLDFNGGREMTLRRADARFNPLCAPNRALAELPESSSRILGRYGHGVFRRLSGYGKTVYDLERLRSNDSGV